jgi:hypothetical protein
MNFIRNEDQNGYVSFNFKYSPILRGLEVREWSKRGDYYVHYQKHDRRGEKSIWVHNGGGVKEFDSAEECKKDLIRIIKNNLEDIRASLLTSED